jgi:hypothetical protein
MTQWVFEQLSYSHFHGLFRRYNRQVVTQFLACCVALIGLLQVAPAAASAEQCQAIFSTRENVVNTKYGDVTITSETAIALLRDQRDLRSIMQLRGREKMAALLRYARQKTQSRVNVALTFLNYGTALYLAYDIALKISENPQAALTSAALIPATLVATDAVSSAYHYFLDNWASERNRIWGSPARAFRMHHEVPNNLEQTGFVQNVSAFSKLMAPLYVATAIASPHLSPEIQTQALVALLLFSHGTEIHRQAHLPNPNRFVRWLQNKRILLSPDLHNSHHTRPVDSDYGIINGLTNRGTNGLFERLNRILTKWTGRLPSTWLQTPKSIPDSMIREMISDIDKVPEELVVAAATSKHSDARVDEVLKLYIEKFGEQPTSTQEGNE